MGIGDRIFYRLNTRFPLLYRIQNEETFQKAWSDDISSKGLGFWTEQSLEPDSILDIHFHLPWQFNSIRVEAQVRFQRLGEAPGRKKLYRTGIQFLDCKEKDEARIAKFILRRTQFALSRWLALGLGFLGVILLSTRALYYGMMNFFSQTEFGAEWLTGLWQKIPLVLVSGLHLLVAVGLGIGCIAYFTFQRKSPWIIMVFSSIGILGQLVRFLFKFSYLMSDPVSQVICLSEVLFLLVFVILFLNVLGMGTGFNQVIQSWRTHLELQTIAVQKQQEEFRKGKRVSWWR